MKKYNIIGVLFLLPMLFNLVYAYEYGTVQVSNIVRVYDGDTFTVNISSFPDIIGRNVNVRINGIDTPEIRAKCSKEKSLALEAKRISEERLVSASKVYLYNIRRDKYFRILADVSVDGEDLGSILLAKRVAVFYDGKTKHNWCDYEE